MGRSRQPSNLTTRVLTAAIGIPLVVAVDYFGGWVFAAAIALTAVVACVEFFGIQRGGNAAPLALVFVPASVAAAVVAAAVHHPQNLWVLIIVLAMFAGGAYYLAPAQRGTTVLNWAMTVFGTIYVGILLGHLTLLRTLHHGARWVALALVLTWAYDTGAYFAGRFYGRHSFMAHISAKKTVEGVLGGLALAAVAGLAGAALLGFALWQGAVLGLLAGVIAQIGDLLESMMKRQAGVKDSGTIIPGHGGLLDRIDSLLFTGAAVYYAAVLLGYGS